MFVSPAFRRFPPFGILLLLALLATPSPAQERQSLTFTDIMKIRQVEQPTLSADGRWVALTAQPDRGDPEVIVRAVDGDARYTIALASHPQVSADARWVAARLNPSLEARKASEGEELHRGMALLSLADGSVTRVEDVQDFALSQDGAWLAYRMYAADEEEEGGEEEAEEAGDEAPSGDRQPGTTLVVRDLSDGVETEIPHVRGFSFGDQGRLLAYSVASPDNSRDGLYVRDLESGTEQVADARPFGHYGAMVWQEDGATLAFTVAEEDEDGEPGHARVATWSGEATVRVTGDDAPDGWFIPADNHLEWSEDGASLFFGWRPLRADEMEDESGEAMDEADPDMAEEAEAEPFDPYDTEEILADRGVDVWHWLDPRIMPQQKVMWPRIKDRTYTAVHHLDAGRTVALADPDLPDVGVPGHGGVALADSDVPYRRSFTWMGGQSDIYVVDLETGRRTLVAEALPSGRPSLSPDGDYVTYWADGSYHLYDVASGTTRNLTGGLGVPVANEDHDYPEPAPGYGVAGWMEDGDAVLLYDKYDIWVVPIDGAAPWSLTDGAGRNAHRVFRILDTDGEDDAIGSDEELTLTSYHDLQKDFGFYRARADGAGVTRLLEEDKRYRFLEAAEDADRLLFTREDYDEFPDLWVADGDLDGARKVTDVNPGLTERFAWGTSELVEWESLDGTPLQGVVIKPGNYEEGKRYPVLVYYYRFFSQRLHEFNEPAINHRPSFPLYASNGYVVFLPDVRFDVGTPGYASTKSVVPGVQHLIDIGLADPDAIALHGHSWSGYQTAFMVTQTDIFKTAIAGAPVANMTSAYSGIRLGSGLARQFQYEMSQSRIGASMWERRDLYIENSPVFFADRIETPMLILHGDVDDAVPWEQSIEMYLAMRRLDKEAVFLQYRDEPHHPQTYANKLDWAMKMKEWIDHYLKGAPAPAWITEGVPYTGR